MTAIDLFQILLFFALLLIVAVPLGNFMAKIFSGEPTWISRRGAAVERGIYKVTGVDAHREMGWVDYAKALMAFNILGICAVFLLQRLQSVLPLNPQDLPAVGWDSAFNTAVSFVTNTNWQGYAGETTMSYLTQMLALTTQNFVSAATGIAVVLGLTRGLSRASTGTIGNFWVDLTRSVLYVLLPLSVLLAVVLIAQGTVQTFAPYLEITTLEGGKQTLPFGPAASQIAIKMLGTNGGGFFNANSAHPFENPTPLTNFLQMLAIFAIPAALTVTFGRMVGSVRQGWTVFATMAVLFVVMLSVSLFGEFSSNPTLGTIATMEGKETRFGPMNSVLFSVLTTAASCGAVNSMHASLSPLAGSVALFNMMVGEVIFGGVGAGLYGMLLFVLVTVFLAGLMVGRTPEYLGKKIEASEMKMLLVAILAPSAMILIGAGLSAVLPAGLSSLTNKGPHGLGEILYAFTSAAANNGSAFAGLNANTPWYNLTLAVAMFVGRFAVILPLLAVAGSMGRKKISPPSPGTFATDRPIFVVLLIGTIVIVGALTFLPALSLTTLMEQFMMIQGRTF